MHLNLWIITLEKEMINKLFRLNRLRADRILRLGPKIPYASKIRRPICQQITHKTQIKNGAKTNQINRWPPRKTARGALVVIIL